MNALAIITQRTGRLANPYWMAPRSTAFAWRTVPPSRFGVNPTSCISRNAVTKLSASAAGAQHVRHAEIGRLRDVASQHRSAEHRHALDDLTAGEHRVERAVVTLRLERIDEPGLNGAREEREAQPQQR